MNIPGRIACESASPINDIFLKTMKVPKIPHVMPMIPAVAKDLTAQDVCSISIKSVKKNVF